MKTNEQYRQLEAVSDGLTLALTAATELIREQAAENEALKAQMETIKAEVVLVPSFCGSASYTDSDTIYACIAEAKLEEICEKTPLQCLAQVKHDAIIEAVEATKKDIDLCSGSVEICETINIEEYATNILTQEQDK